MEPGVPLNPYNGQKPLPTTLRSVLVASDLALDEFEKLLTLDDKRYENPHIYPKFML